MVDDYAIALVRANSNLLVPWLLMASYAYYIEDRPIIADATFDFFCLRLTRHWSLIRHHHKWLIDRKRLFTGHYLAVDDYPLMIAGAVNYLRINNAHRIFDSRRGSVSR